MPEYLVTYPLGFIIESEDEELLPELFEEMAYDFFRYGNAVNREDLVIEEA